RGLSGVGLEETPELLRVKKANQILNQKYKDEAEQLRGRYSLLPETPEMERVRANQRNLSSVRPELMRGLMASVSETPEIVLARENAKNFSDVRSASASFTKPLTGCKRRADQKVSAFSVY
uniref:NEBU n=1 Tax=Fundulus heteroclitus TaxID=8078 RepID=A0A3Q2NWI4_FUNHE